METLPQSVLCEETRSTPFPTVDALVLSKVPSVAFNILKPAALSVQLASKHYGSNDYFQQLLSFDFTLEALLDSREHLWHKVEDLKLPGQNTEHYVALQRYRSDVDILIEKFEALQLGARNNFELRARSLRKDKKGIMDLPNELLKNPDWDYKADTVDIQNVRLAHRKFLEHTSHLLIRYLDVSPTRSSLERLENIMRHPEISQGQRLLRVDLRYYRASMAEDSREFAQICHHKMQIGTRSLEIALKRSKEAQATPSTPRDGSPQAAMGEALSEDGVPEETLSEDDAPEDIPLEDIILSPAASEFITSGTSAQEFSLGYATWEDGALEDMFAKAQRILSSWGPLANGAAADEEGAHLDEAALALRRGHERYRALHLEQNELISDGRFVQAIAAAMASGHSRGQPSLWLCMSDDEGISHYHHNPSGSKKAMTPNYLADLDLLIQSHMIKPSPWFEHGPEEGEDAPQWLLYQLPLAMRAAGVALAGLKVQINSPFIFNLNMSQGQISGLREVAETLDIFEFHLEEEWSQGPDHQDSPGTLAGFYAYVSAAMGRQGVPILTFEVNPPGESCFELRPLFTSPSWQRLELAEFAGISMGIQDLRRLAGMLQPGVCLQLSSVNLTSGTWAAALDCLRSKARWGSYVADCRGAECDELDGEEYDSIFVVDLYGRLGSIGKATLYITSQIHKNPLRKDDVAIEATPEV